MTDIMDEIPEAAAILLSKYLVGCNYVHHDGLTDYVAEFGDVVNIGSYGSYGRYNYGFETVSCPLNQPWGFNFIIRDGEHSSTLQDVIDFHMVNPIKSMAQSIDRCLYKKIIDHPDITCVSGRDAVINAQAHLNITTSSINRHCIIPDELVGLMNLPRPNDFSIQGDDVLSEYKMGVAFYKNAIVLCTRKTKPKGGKDTRHYAAVHNNIVVNCDMSYHVNTAGVLVEISVLGGIVVLEPDMVCLMSFAKGS